MFLLPEERKDTWKGFSSPKRKKFLVRRPFPSTFLVRRGGVKIKFMTCLLRLGPRKRSRYPRVVQQKSFPALFQLVFDATFCLSDNAHYRTSMWHSLQPQASQPRVINTNPASVEPTNTSTVQKRTSKLTKK